MWKLLITASLRRSRRYLFEQLILILSIGLSVSVFVAVLFAAHESVRSFRDGATHFKGSRFSEFRRREGLISEDEMRGVLQGWQSEDLPIGFLEVSAALRTSNGSEYAMLLLGIDHIGALQTEALKEIKVKNESADMSQLLVSTEQLRKMNIATGDRVQLRFHDRIHSIKVSHDTSGIVSGGAALLGISELQRITQMRGWLSGFYLPSDPGLYEAFTNVAKALSSVGREYYVKAPDDSNAALEGIFNAFRLNIFILSALTVVVCAILVLNASQISALGRVQEIAILRTLGVERKQVFVLFLAELITMGMIGALIGLTFGRSLTIHIAQLFLNTVSTLYLGYSDLSQLVIQLSPTLILSAGLVGIATALLGGAYPLWRASAEPPSVINRGRRSALQSSSTLRVLPICGILCITTLLWFWARWGMQPIPTYLTALFTVLSTALLTPLLLRGGARYVLQHVLRRGNVALVSAASEVCAGLSTYSLAAIIVSLSVTLYVAIGALIGSFSATLENWSERTFQADLFIKPGFLGTAERPSSISTHVVQSLTHAEQVAALSLLSTKNIFVQGKFLTVSGVSMAVNQRYQVYQILKGVFNLNALERGEELLISESAERKIGASVGDTITVSGKLFKIAAVYKDFSRDRGIIALDYSVFQQLFGAAPLESLSVYLRDPDRAVQVRAELQETLSEYALEILIQSEIRQTVRDIFNQTFEITKLMRSIVVILCVAGGLLHGWQRLLQRKRELKLLTMIGMSSNQLTLSFVGEGGLTAAAGALCGALGGITLSYILITLINPVAFGWSLQWRWFPGEIFGALGGVIGIAILSGVLIMRVGRSTIQSVEVRYE